MIHHDQACELLESFLSGEMRGNRRAEMRQHLAMCEECSAWADSYRLFSEALAGFGSTDSGGHPSGEQLAYLLVDRRRLTASVRDSLEEHVETCSACRRELSLTKQALASASDQVRRVDSPAASGGMTPRQWLPLAAGLFLALALAFVTQPREPNGSPSRADSHHSLAGNRVVEAVVSIIASSVAVEPDSDVTFRAGESVVLSDGFSIGSGASFRVEIARSSTENLPSHRTLPSTSTTRGTG